MLLIHMWEGKPQPPGHPSRSHCTEGGFLHEMRGSPNPEPERRKPSCPGQHGEKCFLPEGRASPKPRGGQTACQSHEDKRRRWPSNLISVECPEKQSCSQSREKIVSMVSQSDSENDLLHLDLNPDLWTPSGVCRGIPLRVRLPGPAKRKPPPSSDCEQVRSWPPPGCPQRHRTLGFLLLLLLKCPLLFSQ